MLLVLSIRGFLLKKHFNLLAFDFSEVGGEDVAPFFLDPQGGFMPLGGGLDLLTSQSAVITQEETKKL